jgi:hypothetical protein
METHIFQVLFLIGTLCQNNHHYLQASQLQVPWWQLCSRASLGMANRWKSHDSDSGI